MGIYGDTDVIKTRTGASPETFGFEGETNPEDALDNFIDQLQERASSRVERYTGMRFDETTNTTDYIESTGREYISTRNDPVRQIHTLKEGGRELTEGEDFRLEPVPGMPDENIGRLKRISSGARVRTHRWRPGVEIEIEYDWGYDDQTRPAAIDQIVEDMVVLYVNETTAERKADGVESESMDGFNVSYALARAEDRMQLTEGMRTKLEPFTRQGMA